VQARESPLIVLDAGSGARRLGEDCAKRESGFNPLSANVQHKDEVHFFLSHVHWDHVQGFPFFVPAYMPKTKIFFYEHSRAPAAISDTMKLQQRPPNFPNVNFKTLPGEVMFREMPVPFLSPVRVGAATVAAFPVQHPNSAFGYQVKADGKAFVFATDNEHGDALNPVLLQAAQNADILYYDAQYLPEEYPKKINWGHSTYEWGVLTALAANVKTLVLGHHEPSRDDFGLAKLLSRAKEFAASQVRKKGNKGKTIEVRLAYDGMVCELR